jgi:hypothetical protein
MKRYLWMILVLAALGAWLVGCPTPCDCPDDDSAAGDDDTCDDDDVGDDDTTPVDDDDSAGDDDTSDDDDTATDDDTADDDDTTADVDNDGDGYTPADGDCDDADDEIHPGAEDTCGDDVDDDCDGIADRGCQCYVPEGEFLMGMAEDVGGFDQRPQHAVWLDEFWVDKYEVTVGEYQQCELAGVCAHPRFDYSFARDHYYDDPDYVDYPVIYIQRDDARDYCTWMGGYLTREAQWEKAARGHDDARLFPWGDWYDCSYGNANWCVGETSRIGSYDVNRSPYGVADMSGNVWEFFEDFYDPTYYQNSPYMNPTGPTTGEHLSYRGGAFTWWGNPSVSVRHPARDLGSSFYNIGFRCAYDEPY